MYECDQHEISTCVFHSFAILSRSTRRSGVFLVPCPSTRPFLRRRIGRADGFFSRHGYAAAAHKLGSWTPTFRLLFCKVLFFRNAGPTIVFPRCALAHSYRFLQSGPRYIGTPPPPSFSASDSVLPPRHARLESVLRREFTKSPGYTLSRFYTAGQANFGDRTMSGIPVERSLRFIGPILETSCVVRRIFVELMYCYKKREYIFSISLYLLTLRISLDGCPVNALEFVYVRDVRSTAAALFNVHVLQEVGNLAARLLVGFFVREGNFPFG